VPPFERGLAAEKAVWACSSLIMVLLDWWRINNKILMLEGVIDYENYE